MSRPTVLITRERPHPLASMLEAHGCDTLHWPVSVLVPTHAPAPSLTPPVACLVTSAASVRFVPPTLWPRVPIVAVGEATARAIRQAGGEVHDIAEGSGAAALARLPATGAVWFIGATRPAPAVQAALDTGRLVHWAAYDRAERSDPPALSFVERVDVVTLASPSAARVWCTLAASCEAPLVVIGETTAAAVRGLGRSPAAVAARPTLEDLALAAAQITHRLRG